METVSAPDVFPGLCDALGQSFQGFEIIALTLHEEALLHRGIFFLCIVVGTAEKFIRLLIILVVFLDLLQLKPEVGHNLFGHIQAAVPHLDGGLVHFDVEFIFRKVGRMDQGVGQGQGGRIQGDGYLIVLFDFFRRALRRHFP